MSGYADGAAALPATGTAGWRRPAAQCRSTRTGGDHDEANRLLVYRQVHYSESNAHQSVDLLLGLNGILVATSELKNPFTGQTVEDAVHQYQDPAQRNPKDKIFARRCLAHFAVDPTLVSVTTRLAGASTVFLPFNQGSGGAGNEGGKGNPDNPHGHRTAYLWEQVWQRDNWLDLLHRFAQETPGVKGRKVLFPRYHQWDVVHRLVDHAAVHGAGQSYLLQHSAGSGKSNSIRLASPPPRRPAYPLRPDPAVCGGAGARAAARRAGVPQGRRHHRPHRAGRAASGDDLRLRPRPGDAAADRQELPAAPRGARGHQDEDRHHDAAEVPGHRHRRPAGGQAGRGHRRRGAQQPDNDGWIWTAWRRLTTGPAADDPAGVLVAAAHELEEQVGGFGLERDVADLVDDQQPVAAEGD